MPNAGRVAPISTDSLIKLSVPPVPREGPGPPSRTATLKFRRRRHGLRSYRPASTEDFPSTVSDSERHWTGDSKLSYRVAVLAMEI